MASSVGWNGILGRVRRVEQSLRGVRVDERIVGERFRRERGFTGTQSRSSVASRAVTARRLFGLGLFVIRRLVVADEEDLEREKLQGSLESARVCARRAGTRGKDGGVAHERRRGAVHAVVAQRTHQG